MPRVRFADSRDGRSLTPVDVASVRAALAVSLASTRRKTEAGRRHAAVEYACRSIGRLSFELGYQQRAWLEAEIDIAAAGAQLRADLEGHAGLRHRARPLHQLVRQPDRPQARQARPRSSALTD